MCGMNFRNPSRTEVVGFCALIVIFSPLIIVGGAVYLAGKGVVTVCEKTKEAIGNQKKARYQEDFCAAMERRQHDKVDAKKHADAIMQLRQQDETGPTYHIAMQIGSALYTTYHDYIGSYAAFQNAVKRAASPLETGTSTFMLGMTSVRLNRPHEGYEHFIHASRSLPAKGDVYDDVAFTQSAAVFQAGWTAMLVALYPYMVAATDIKRSFATRDEALLAAHSHFDRVVSEDPSDFAAVYHAAVARYFIESDDGNLDKALLMLQPIPDGDEYGPVARAMEGQALARLKRPTEALAAQQLALKLNPDLHVVSLADADALLRPWPVPPEMLNGSAGPHDWDETRFAKPTWCDRCMKFITFSQNIDKCYECKRCHMKFHREFHDAVGSLPQCFATVAQVPIALWAKVEYPMGNGTFGKGEVVEVNCDTGMLLIRRYPSDPWEPKCHCIASLCRLTTEAPLLGNHTHVLKQCDLHHPTWCDVCHKFIWETVALQCEMCQVRMHADCNHPHVVPQ